MTQVGSWQAEGQAQIERQRQADTLTYHRASSAPRGRLLLPREAAGAPSGPFMRSFTKRSGDRGYPSSAAEMPKSVSRYRPCAVRLGLG